MRHMKSRIGIYFLAVLLPVLASCDYRYELEGLRVQSKLYNLKASEGSTPVIIYAGGDWTVSLTEQVDWAELDRDHGSGQGQVMFTYSANDWLARMVGVVVECQGLRDTVMMVQAAGMTETVLRFSKADFDVPGCSGRLNAPYETNLGDFRSLLKTEILYGDDAAGDWVTDVELDTTALSCKVMSYSGSMLVRKAKIVLYVDDGAGNSVADTIRVCQSSADPYIKLFCPDKVEATGGLVNLGIDSNLGDYMDSLISTVSLDFAGADPWASVDLQQSSDQSLVLMLNGNTQVERTMNVSFSNTDNEGKIHKFSTALTQLCSELIVSGTNESVVDSSSDSFSDWNWAI